ncbi:glycoside hydrolase family 2 protein [Ktedonosporobacter rubrisoli]|uniref:Beta-mannosidase B n=1 Tax=Ktedonosporobacter rubrisoli TaxID=2509675 RepID=A0A4P6JZY5_KTERU|nr:glycoside hydrolase family 2 protein [Ktedonosporobacter rubrisoli]QBD81072.1 glycoside hydrolase family 2 protein [Ktedonosporobacter rubrisoli]
MEQILLSENWQLKQRNPALPLAADFASSEDWVPASVPGTVHQALLAAGRIPDPFVDLHENDVQWIGEQDWLYRCEFAYQPAGSADAQEVALNFAGLDTYATVWLNGTQILTSSNMFVPARVQVKDLLREGRNELHILFASALRRGKELEAEHGELVAWNGDPSRLYVRKAQYHYGWDWGPTLLTAGPWRTISLQTYRARIADLHCPAEVAADLQSATLPVRVAVEEQSRRALTVHLALYAPSGERVDEVQVPLSGNEARHTFRLASPALWYPRGYGEQAFYRLVATLHAEDQELDRTEQRLGLRRLQLIQRQLAEAAGSSFFFEINNVPVFCGGANWIPADSFTPRVTAERYRQWLQLAAEANMVMLRVWGGGIYEDDAFYQTCDELGLLVWQDFMFACGLYPAQDWFMESVQAEVEATLQRLRHHPCLVLWCGNNEDYMVASSLGRYDQEFEGDFQHSAFPARAIYEKLLPRLCAELDPTRPYWRGSPYGGKSGNETELGDQHVWDVWHGSVAPYQEYPRLAGRFVSEFGMEAFPVLETIAEFVEPAERYAQSRTLDLHNKATGGARRMATYMIENIRLPASFAGYVYATQFIQAEALAAALRSWRRLWRGPGHEQVAGALVWQLNDCWPVTSWALVDYALRPKPAYYVVRRELAPLSVGLVRQTPEQVAIWACSSLQTECEVELELRSWSLEGSLQAEERRTLKLGANRAVELGELALSSGDNLVLGARLRKDGEVVARATLWPEPFRYLSLPDPALTIERLDEQTVRVQAARPAKGVWLQASSEASWSDNMLDVLPDDPQVIVAKGLGNAEIKVTNLFSYVQD